MKFRLLVAGGKANLIALDAIESLHRLSGGIPREINRICHNALGLAAREQLSQVDAALIERVAAAAPAPLDTE